jgi:hypothetical protein
MVESEERYLARNVGQDASRRQESAIVSRDAACGGKRPRHARLTAAFSMRTGALAIAAAEPRRMVRSTHRSAHPHTRYVSDN